MTLRDSKNPRAKVLLLMCILIFCIASIVSADEVRNESSCNLVSVEGQTSEEAKAMCSHSFESSENGPYLQSNWLTIYDYAHNVEMLIMRTLEKKRVALGTIISNVLKVFLRNEFKEQHE